MNIKEKITQDRKTTVWKHLQTAASTPHAEPQSDPAFILMMNALERFIRHRISTFDFSLKEFGHEPGGNYYARFAIGFPHTNYNRLHKITPYISGEQCVEGTTPYELVDNIYSLLEHSNKLDCIFKRAMEDHNLTQ